MTVHVRSKNGLGLKYAKQSSGLYEAINGLPARIKPFAELFWLDKMSHDEVAERLGVGARTSERRIAAARKLLREELEL